MNPPPSFGSAGLFNGFLDFWVSQVFQGFCFRPMFQLLFNAINRNPYSEDGAISTSLRLCVSFRVFAFFGNQKLKIIDFWEVVFGLNFAPQIRLLSPNNIYRMIFA